MKTKDRLFWRTPWFFFFFFSSFRNVAKRFLWKYCNTVSLQGRCFVTIVLELDIDHCCHWEKPCFAPPPLPSWHSRRKPPCRVESGWERNALGCGAAATVGNRRHNSGSMDNNDPYLHLSKYARTINLSPCLPVVLIAKPLCFVLTYRRVRLFHGVFSPACEPCAKASADF